MKYFYHFLLLGSLFLYSTGIQGQNSYDIANQTVTDTVGYFYDPGGSTGDYFTDAVVTFKINVGAGKTLKLQWLEFDVENNDVDVDNVCPYDYIEVFDGDVTTQPSTMMYCGTTLPPNFEVSSGTISIRFTSDGGTVGAGFKAYWTTGNYISVPPPPAGTGYCPGIVGTACDISAIKRFAIANIDNNNDLCDKEYDGVVDNDGYSDYTSMLAQLRIDSVYTVEVEIYNSLITDNAQLWIDWNNDGTWSETERTQLVGDGWQVNLFTGAVVVPPTAVTGKVGRIRVISDFTEPATDPCAQTYSGEVEDYSFVVFNTGESFPGCVDYTKAIPAKNSTDNCLKQTLRWFPTANTTSYTVTLIDTLTGNIVVNNVATTDTFYVVPVSLSPQTAYRWKIKSLNNGAEGYMCDSSLFTTSPNLDPLANITPTGNPLQACVNSNFSIDGSPTQGTTPYAHLWSGTGAASLSSTAVVNPTFNSASTGTFRLVYQVTDDNSCKSSDTVDIQVISGANPGTISNIGPASLCQNTEVRFKITGYSGTIVIQDSIAGGSWTDRATTQVNDSIFSIIEPNAGTVYFRNTAGGTNCSSTGTIVLSKAMQVAPDAPIVVIVGGDSICTGQSTKLVVNNYAANISWNDANNTQNDTLVVTQTGDYIVTYTGGSCPASSVVSKIFVAPLPGNAIDFLGSLSTCADNLPFLFTNPSATETVLWSNGATTKGIVANISGNYSATLTNQFNCSATTATLAVAIHPLPAKPVISQIGSSNPCVGEPVVLKSNYVGGNYWNTGATTDSIVVTNTGKFVVKYTDNFGCKAESDTTYMTFRPAPPKPTISVSGKLNTCHGDSVRLSVNTSTASTWNDANSTVGNNLTVYTNGNYFARFVSVDGCVVYSDTVTINFTQFQPPIKVNIEATDFCTGSEVLLFVNTKTGNTWNDVLTTKNDSLIVTQSGSYFVKNVAQTVCVAYSDTVSIQFEDKPNQPSIYKSGNTLFSTVLGESYQWLGSSGPIANANENFYIPTHTDEYQVVVFTGAGCASSPSGKYYVGFTGINDVFGASISLSPNPFNKELSVTVDAELNYILINQLGQQLEKGILQKGLNLLQPNVPAGVYSLVLSNNEGIVTRQVVKN